MNTTYQNLCGWIKQHPGENAENSMLILRKELKTCH
jgi:hypothetical protein